MALTNKLSAIGDAIRSKTGSSELLTLDQMPTEIESITTSGGKPKVEHYQYIHQEAWTTDATGNTKTFSDTYFINGEGYYQATITNTLNANVSYRARQAMLITHKLLLPIDETNTGAKYGRFYRNGGVNVREGLATNISFYIGAGSIIDVDFIPYDEII